MRKKYLGAMVDCSRNAVMSMDGIKRFIDKLHIMDYNMLMLYTEDTYEVNGEPLFGYRRGRYTKSELKEIDAYADGKGIELIPCIQTLAHLNQLFLHGMYYEIRDTDDILLVDCERTYELIENIFSTLKECFKSRYVHIGMDEAANLGCGKYKNLNGEKSQVEIFCKHLNRVCDIAKKYGFTPLMWSDMFFSMSFGGRYYVKDGTVPKDVINAVPQGVELVYWDYYSTDADLYKAMLDKHKSFGKEVWFAGGAWKWGGFSSDNKKSLKNSALALDACAEKGVDKIIVTMWGDGGCECPVDTVLPSLFFVSEYFKGNRDLTSIKKKFGKTFNADWDDFMLFDMELSEDCPKNSPDEENSKALLYNDVFTGRYDSTLLGGGKDEEEFGKLADKFSSAARKNTEFSYMFESYRALCDVLSVKASLGDRTRNAYKRKDYKELESLIEQYKLTEEKTEVFLEAFWKTWITDNKPYGFDVQEIRLGGLIKRTERCRKRIEDFLAGKISVIEELEEETVDFHDGGKDFKRAVTKCYSYVGAVTANRL